MRKNTTRIERNNYLSHVFDQLGEEGQAYAESLTAQLAIIQSRCKRQTSPEKQVSTGKKPESILQQNKEQEK
jgi:hypothetical protein